MLIKVRDRKTGNERTVTQKAYAAMGPKVYEKLGFVNDDGSEIEGSPNQNTPQVQQIARSVKGARPVVVRTQLVKTPEPMEQPEQDTEQENAAPVPEVKERRKPGPKPKTQPAQESISSNSNADEQ